MRRALRRITRGLVSAIPVAGWRRRLRDRVRIGELMREEAGVRRLDLDGLTLSDDHRARLARVRELAGAFKRVVVWGFHRRFHTHRFIHSSYFQTLVRLGIPVTWVDSEPANNARIEAGDLVLSANYVGEARFGGHCLQFRPDVSYVLHNAPASPEFDPGNADPSRVLFLQVYRDYFLESVSDDTQRLDPVTYLDVANRTLIQPWGTDRLPWEFLPPTSSESTLVHWVGTVWHENREVIAELREVLETRGLQLVITSDVTAAENIRLVRESRLAPAIAGAGHVQSGYLPCRVFKNISYGQLAFTNVPRFAEFLGDSAVPIGNIAEMVDAVLALDADARRQRILAQQARIGSHTYLDKFINIFDALRQVRETN